jgi:hypothetical protein
LLELVLADLEIAIRVNLITLDDVVVRNFFAGFGVDLLIFDPMTSVFVDLIEADLFGTRTWRGKERSVKSPAKGAKSLSNRHAGPSIQTPTVLN